MSELLIPILIVMLAFAVVCRLLLVARCWCDGSRAMSALSVLLLRLKSIQSVRDSVYYGRRSAAPRWGGLNCRVQLTKQEKDLPAVQDLPAVPDSGQAGSGQAGDCVFDVFSVEICGLIPACGDTDFATLKVSIVDITDGIAKAKPIQARVKHWQVQEWFPQDGGQSIFCYNAELGRLPRRVTALSDWVSVAQLRVDWLRFPRKGKRNLQFNTSILSRESGEELVSAECTFAYENPDFGYIDLEENNRRTKTLTVALAFAVSAADKRLYNCEIELIKNWARANIGWAQASNKARRKLEKALSETIAFLRDGNQLNTSEICKELVEIAPLAERYEILDLCLYVVRADGFVTADELDILKNLANWLKVDVDRFREMMGKILPVSICEVKDAEVILGVTSDMNGEKAREHLNKEYIKWNSRVTNSNPEIQSQADQMLKLIAEARNRYTRSESSN